MLPEETVRVQVATVDHHQGILLLFAALTTTVALGRPQPVEVASAIVLSSTVDLAVSALLVKVVHHAFLEFLAMEEVAEVATTAGAGPTEPVAVEAPVIQHTAFYLAQPDRTTVLVMRM